MRTASLRMPCLIALNLAIALPSALFGPVDCSALARFRATLPQARLSEAGRAENVRGAFRVDAPGRVRGRRVLLVDDVVTTGATANECARVLKQAGATSVDLWSIARAL